MGSINSRATKGRRGGRRCRRNRSWSRCRCGARSRGRRWRNRTDVNENVLAGTAEPGGALDHPPLEMVTACFLWRGYGEGKRVVCAWGNVGGDTNPSRTPGGVVLGRERSELSGTAASPGDRPGVLKRDGDAITLTGGHHSRHRLANES